MLIVHAALIAVLAQSSAGPSDGLGSSAGPVGGSINPYTATPGSMSGGSTAPTSTGLGGTTRLGTQQEQSGSVGEGPKGAASPITSTSGKTTTTGRGAGTGGGVSGEIDKADQPNVDTSGPGPAGLDKGTSAYSNSGKGAGLMDTGNAVTAVPPPSLTNTGTAKRSSEPNQTSRTGAKPSSSSTPTTPPTTPETPPPSPAESGSSSTR